MGTELSNTALMSLIVTGGKTHLGFSGKDRGRGKLGPTSSCTNRCKCYYCCFENLSETKTKGQSKQ